MIKCLILNIPHSFVIYSSTIKPSCSGVCFLSSISGKIGVVSLSSFTKLGFFGGSTIFCWTSEYATFMQIRTYAARRRWRAPARLTPTLDHSPPRKLVFQSRHLFLHECCCLQGTVSLGVCQPAVRPHLPASILPSSPRNA